MLSACAKKVNNENSNCYDNVIKLYSSTIVFERNGENKGYQSAASIFGSNNELHIDGKSSLKQINGDVDYIFKMTETNLIDVSGDVSLYITELNNKT